MRAGALGLVAAMLPLASYGTGTTVAMIVAAGAVLGVAMAFVSLGLQTWMYQQAPVGRMGAASGLFQSCRSVGAIVATGIVAASFAEGVASAGVHGMAIVGGSLSAVVAVTSLRR